MNYREVKASERLPDKREYHAVKLYYKNDKASNGFTGYWYNPRLNRYKKQWREMVYIWLEPIPEITEREIDELWSEYLKSDEFTTSFSFAFKMGIKAYIKLMKK